MATSDLIWTSLEPTTLCVGELVDAVLRVHNVSDGLCTNLILEFELPQALELNQGRRRIEFGRLGPGEQQEHHITLEAREPGPCGIALVNFSFQDGTGCSQRYHHRSIDIDVQPSPVAPQLSEQPTKALPPRPSPPSPPSSVFISYRQDDTGWVVADRLAELLCRYFSRQQVFVDRRLESGTKFSGRLDAELESCAALLALIGPRWLAVTTASGERRIDDEDDIVRHEIAVALRRDILVIPVLIDTRMPSARELPPDIRCLTYRTAQTLSRKHFNTDVREIVLALRSVLQPPA